MEEYQLIIRIPFKTVDDPAARQEANSILKDLPMIISNPEISIKLHKLISGKPPEKIAL